MDVTVSSREMASEKGIALMACDVSTSSERLLYGRKGKKGYLCPRLLAKVAQTLPLDSQSLPSRHEVQQGEALGYPALKSTEEAD